MLGPDAVIIEQHKCNLALEPASLNKE